MQAERAVTRNYALPPVHPFLGMDMFTMLEAAAAEVPDKQLLTWEPFDGEPQVWTYAEVLAESRAVAAALRERGITAGDRVLVHLENCPEFLFAWFGCAALHAVAVTTNSRSSVDELAYYIENSGSRAGITQASFAESVGRAGPGLEWLAVVGAGTGDPAGGELDFADLRGDASGLTRPEPDPAAPLSIQYTSGTTSRPKGVLWTQANGLWAARVNALHEGLRSDDVHLVYMPLFHTNAMSYSVLASIWMRARFVLQPKWSTSRFWEVSNRNGCTWVSLMGLSVRAILTSQLPESHTYRVFGDPSGNPLFREHLGVRTVAWWGMTETVSHGIVSDGVHIDVATAIGRAAPEYEIAVRRADGNPAGPGEVGELFCRGITGVSMFAEYWNNPQATADAHDEDGWLITGDLVRVNEDGSFSFADRAKDMLKVGAENVAASEIERVVQEVVVTSEVSVVGQPDDTLDEVPVVFVVDPDPAEGLEERILTACRAQLADFKVPRAVHFVDVLPHSTLRKVHKVELRRVLADGEPIAEAQRRWAAADTSDPSGDGDPGSGV